MPAEPDFTVFDTLNGLVETSMRLLVVLERFHGIGLSLEELRLADFFVVFTEDIGGPSSLHVPLSNRAGSFTIRGDHHLPSALTFLQRADLVTLEGSRYFGTHASDNTPFTSQYLTALDEAATWLKDRFDAEGRVTLFPKLKARAFQLIERDLAIGEVHDDQHFSLMQKMYPADLTRLAGLVESCKLFIAYLGNDHKIAANENGGALPSFSYFVQVAEKANTEASKLDVSWSELKELTS